MATLPRDYPMVIYRGTAFTQTFRWKPDGVTGQDFTGWAATFYLGSPGRDPELVIDTEQLTTALTLGTDGSIVLILDAATTFTLPPDVYVYNLDLTPPAGDPFRFVHGRMDVKQDAGPPL